MAGRFDVTREFQGSDLGDARLDARLGKIAGRVAEQPGAGFPTALVTAAETEAFYRFVANDKVTLEGVLAPHKRATAERCRAAGEVVIAVDRTEMAFRGDRADDLEELTATTSGFSAFAALAITLERTPLGVLDMHPLEEAAGRQPASRWAECVERVGAALPETVQATFVMDREADAYQLLCALAAAGHSCVVRGKYDRLVAEGGDTIKEVVRREPCMLERDVPLSRRTTKGKPPASAKKHPPRNGRQAQLAVRASAIELPRPPKAPRDLPAKLELHVVHVTEPNPPAGEAPVEWLLLTNLPISTPSDVEAVIDRYRARWMIEEFFKALKTGCAYEDRQLESRQTLLVALGLLAPIAWQLLLLRAESRTNPKMPAERVLTATQILLLQVSDDVKLCANPTVEQATLAIARLGGHMRQNGPPGWQVLWRGFEKLRAWEMGFAAAQALAARSDQ